MPDSIHNSQVTNWGNIYVKLGPVYEKPGAKYSVNSAFGQARKEFLRKLSQGDFLSSADSIGEISINN